MGLVLCALAPAAKAARPLNTDDARIVEPKACQLETWTRKNRNSSEYWALPGCNFTGNLELTAGGATTKDDSGTHTTDVVFQAKTILKPLEKNGWGLGLAVGTVKHPRAEMGGRDLYVYLPASYSFAEDRFVLHTNVGLLREQEAGRTKVTWGVGSETELTSRTWLIAETFGQNQGKPQFQVGLRQWIVPGHIQVDATFGNRFGSETGGSWFSLGLRLLSIPFLR